VAALRHGIQSVVLPHANAPELERLPDEVREGLRFVPVRTMDEVIDAALVTRPREVMDGVGDGPVPLSPQ